MTDRKLALVTGASMGLGADFARLAAADGYDVVLVARSRDKLEALAAELAERHGVEAIVEPADLTDPTAPARLHAALAERGRAVDVLVNNAGFGSNGPFLENDRQRELDMIQVNVTALVALTHLFANDMLARNRGHVLNIASTAGMQPGPRMAVYFATKAFVISFGEAIAHELRKTGVRVTTLCPGAVATEFGHNAGSADTLLFKLQVADSSRVARDGWEAMKQGRVLKVSGFLNWLMAVGVRFTPPAVLRFLAERMST